MSKIVTRETREAGRIKLYRELKQKHADSIILLRCGDFYETYEQCAEVASEVLGLTLTTHDAGYKIASFPYHALDIYLPKLIRAGRRVAICDGA